MVSPGEIGPELGDICRLLESTGDRPIVEESRRDDFWGAKPTGDHLLVGMNILGRLLMELRDKAREGGPEAFRLVPPPKLENFVCSMTLWRRS